MRQYIWSMRTERTHVVHSTNWDPIKYQINANISFRMFHFHSNSIVFSLYMCILAAIDVNKKKKFMTGPGCVNNDTRPLIRVDSRNWFRGISFRFRSKDWSTCLLHVLYGEPVERSIVAAVCNAHTHMWQRNLLLFKNHWATHVAITFVRNCIIYLFYRSIEVFRICISIIANSEF